MTQAEKLEALWQYAIDRAYEFDNLDKWQVKVIKKADTVMNDWYQFVGDQEEAIKEIVNEPSA